RTFRPPHRRLPRRRNRPANPDRLCHQCDPGGRVLRRRRGRGDGEMVAARRAYRLHHRRRGGGIRAGPRPSHHRALRRDHRAVALPSPEGTRSLHPHRRHRACLCLRGAGAHQHGCRGAASAGEGHDAPVRELRRVVRHCLRDRSWHAAGTDPQPAAGADRGRTPEAGPLMAAPLLLIAAGGTGGHMFPAQALAEAMVAKGWRVKLSTDARGARYAGGFPRAVTIEEVASATFARGGIAARALVPLRIAAGVAGAYLAVRRDRPAVVVGFGGYPSIPALAAAVLLKIPRMIHEQNGVLGKVNRAFASRVRLIACGTWPTDLPEGVEGSHTGNPVRAAVLERAGAPYIPPGDYPMSVLVIGGSQGARILSDIVPAALALLPGPLRANVRVAHQARPEDRDRVIAAYAGAGIRAEVEPFFEDVPRRL